MSGLRCGEPTGWLRGLWYQFVIPLEMSGLRCGEEFWTAGQGPRAGLAIPLEMSGLRCGYNSHSGVVRRDSGHPARNERDPLRLPKNASKLILELRSSRSK